MKRFLLLGLALVLLGSALFADDAKVMPTRVGRLYLAPSYIFFDKAFDDDGDREDAISTKMFNLGAALEYGITSWITAAVQWTPGINLWSEVDMPLPGSAYIKDMGDLFVGAKLQIVGEQAPLRSSALRLAFAPGAKIPLPGPDFEKEVQNMMTGGDVTVAALDKHVLGVGLRSYLDCVLNEYFFINLYNELIFHPFKGDLRNNNIYLGAAQLGVSGDVDVEYGLDMTFELEPVFSTSIAQGIVFTGGLPVNYQTSPGIKIDHPAFPDLERSHLLTLRPGASIFFMNWALPLEFKASYFLPLWGQNSPVNNVINFQVRAYFRI